MFKIKICGITDSSDALDAIDAGADAIGLNFYSPSVRSVTVDVAEKLLDHVRAERPERMDRIKIVGVFVNHSVAEIAHIARRLDLDALQLHGDERPEFIASDDDTLTQLHKPFIRAIRIAKDLAGSIDPSSLTKEAELWAAAGVQMVLLDAAVPGSYGGTGHSIDWDAVGQIQLPLPVILAGGLNDQNVAAAIRAARPAAVDVASGVESENHRKDGPKVRRFVASAKRAMKDSTG